jgi:indole-3-acetate monooxygenase
LNDAALLRMAAPDPGLPPGEALARAEAVARVHASAGWCVSIHVTSSILLGYLREDLPGVCAGVWAPRGTGEWVHGGLRVSGRWPYCSGITHSDWMFAGCIVDGTLRVATLPVAEMEILDTWDTVGLRATGSHDAVADGIIVPTERVIDLTAGPVSELALYRFPIFGYFAGSIAAAALGNARGAMDEFDPGDRVASRTAGAIARAEASLRAARGLYFDAIDAAWAQAQDGPVSVDARRDLRLAATHATRTAAEVVSAVHDVGGGQANYERSPLARRFRDAHTATGHFQVNVATYELAGRLLLGLDADTSTL